LRCRFVCLFNINNINRIFFYHLHIQNAQIPNVHNSILFNERIMMAITHEVDFVSRAAGEWVIPERVIAIIREQNTILLINN
jgi:hypothetical protein